MISGIYNVTVYTVITHSDGTPFWKDEMNWHSVDEEVRQWLSASCKTALFKLIGVPEVVDGDSYTIAYRTVVKQGDNIVSDSTLVEFPKLSYASIVHFQEFAMSELKEMLALLVRKHGSEPVITKPRNKVLTLVTTLWQVLYALVSSKVQK